MQFGPISGSLESSNTASYEGEFRQACFARRRRVYSNLMNLLSRFGEYHGAGRFVWQIPKPLFLLSLLPWPRSNCAGLRAVSMTAPGQKDR